VKSSKIEVIKIVSESARVNGILESDAEQIAKSVTAVGPNQGTELAAEKERVMKSLREQAAGFRVYREIEWRDGRRYRFDQSVVVGTNLNKLLKLIDQTSTNFIRTYCEPYDLGVHDRVTFYYSHNTKSSGEDVKRPRRRSHLNLDGGSRLPLALRMLISSMGLKTISGLVFSEKKAALLLDSKDGGGLNDVYVQRYDSFVEFSFYSAAAGGRKIARIRLDKVDFRKILEIDIWDAFGKLVYYDRRYNYGSDMFPKRWVYASFVKDVMRTNDVRYLDVSLDLKIEPETFVFNPPEDYEVRRDGKVVRARLIGGTRGHVVPQKSVLEAEQSGFGFSVSRGSVLAAIGVVSMLVLWGIMQAMRASGRR